MGTIPPNESEVDQWLAESGAMTRMISSSFVPGQGFHVQAVIAGYTMNSGARQYSILTGDPTTDPVAAKAVHGLKGEYGDVTLRAYDYTEPLPAVTPHEMAATAIEHQRINDMSNWVDLENWLPAGS